MILYAGKEGRFNIMKVKVFNDAPSNYCRISIDIQADTPQEPYLAVSPEIAADPERLNQLISKAKKKLEIRDSGSQ